jgi:hypothetical protein
VVEVVEKKETMSDTGTEGKNDEAREMKRANAYGEFGQYSERE